MNPVLTALQAAVQDVATRVGPSVVGLGRGWARGSGVVVAPGRVLTAAHVVRNDEVTVVFGDGRSVPGRVLGTDTDLDIAVIEADTADIPEISWGEGDPVAIGSPVLALANPGGHGLRVTF